MLPNTSVVDDQVTALSSDLGMFTEPSPTKSSKKSRSSEVEGFVNVSLPSDASAYLDSSFLKGIAKSLLLPTDRKRLTDIESVQTTEWSMAHVFQVQHVCNL